MTFPRIWIAWLLALVFGFAAPAQAMRGLTGLGTPLGAKSHRVNNPINHTDPSGLDPDFWDIQNNPESYPIPTVRDTILETGGIVLTGLAIYAGVEVVLGTAELISDLGLVRGAVSAGHAYQSETMALILGTQQVPSPINFAGSGKNSNVPAQIKANPSILKNRLPCEVRGVFSDPQKWRQGTMTGNGPKSGKGFTAREIKNGNPTGTYIQYSPGPSKHAGRNSYWKVSTQAGGVQYIPNDF